MRKIFVNNNTANVRTLSPFAYKDTIKTLDKSNEARVTLDGERVFRSAVTSGRDVKSGLGGVKFHLYFYMTKEAAERRDTAMREFLPITAEEFRAYKDDPAYVMELVTADPVTTLAEPETKVVPEAAAGNEGSTEEPEQETEVVPEPEAGNEGTNSKRKAKRK